MRRIIALITLALVAAACGSAESSAAFESQDSPTSTTAVPAASVAPSPSTTSSAPEQALTDTAQPPTTTAAPAPLPDSDYPDVVVADLAGGEVNLRELVLEPRPVLLWFWAPH